jgi:hypothetical protein
MNPGPFASFETEGVITFNGQPLKKNMRSLVGFVEQDDEHHYPALTVCVHFVVGVQRLCWELLVTGWRE